MKESTKQAAALEPGDEAIIIGNWRRVAAVKDRGGLVVVDTTDGCRVSLWSTQAVTVRGKTPHQTPSGQ